MKGERLTDTIQFKHKNITNPTLSHHDKLMHALAKCKETLDGLLTGKTDQQLSDLTTIVNNVHQQITTADSNKVPAPRVEQSVPRVNNIDIQLQALHKAA
jgi:hypothetical protein